MAGTLTSDSKEQLLTLRMARLCMLPMLLGSCVRRLNDSWSSTMSRSDDSSFGTFRKFLYVKSNVRLPSLMALTMSAYA